VDVSEKDVKAPELPHLPSPPLFVKVPLPALEAPEKVVRASPPESQVEAELLKVVRLPAVALLVNDIAPSLGKPAPALKFCMLPELLVIPAPLIVMGEKDM